jgi:hypothetical protein
MIEQLKNAIKRVVAGEAFEWWVRGFTLYTNPVVYVLSASLNEVLEAVLGR